jgi:hypothetical protein
VTGPWNRKVLRRLPPLGSVNGHSLFSTGFPGSKFPGFSDSMECSDALPSFPPRFVAFAWRYHGVRSGFAPTDAERGIEGLELFSR